MPKGAKAPTSSKLTKEEVKSKAKAAKEEIDRAHSVIRKVTGTDKVEGKGKLANLPLVSSLFESTEEMRRAITLLETGHRLKDEIERMEKGYEEEDRGHVPGLVEVKEDIVGIALGAEVPGYRFGNLVAAVNVMAGRKVLNPDRLRDNLLQAGVDPVMVGNVIEDSYVEGDPYYRVDLKKLDG